MGSLIKNWSLLRKYLGDVDQTNQSLARKYVGVFDQQKAWSLVRNYVRNFGQKIFGLCLEKMWGSLIKKPGLCLEDMLGSLIKSSVFGGKICGCHRSIKVWSLVRTQVVVYDKNVLG